MQQEQMLNLLNDEDFHLDPLGRVVIDNPNILSAINGALMGGGQLADAFVNGGCSNSGCKK